MALSFAEMVGMVKSKARKDSVSLNVPVVTSDGVPVTYRAESLPDEMTQEGILGAFRESAEATFRIKVGEGRSAIKGKANMLGTDAADILESHWAQKKGRNGRKTKGEDSATDAHKEEVNASTGDNGQQ